MLSPVGPTQLRKLDTSGASGHTILPSAAHLSSAVSDRSRIQRTALHLSRANAAASTHPTRVRDDRDTPLWWVGCQSSRVIWGYGNRNILQRDRHKNARRANHWSLVVCVDKLSPCETHHLTKMQSMGIAEFIIGRIRATRWLRPCCAL